MKLEQIEKEVLSNRLGCEYIACVTVAIICSLALAPNWTELFFGVSFSMVCLPAGLLMQREQDGGSWKNWRKGAAWGAFAHGFIIAMLSPVFIGLALLAPTPAIVAALTPAPFFIRFLLHFKIRNGGSGTSRLSRAKSALRRWLPGHQNPPLLLTAT